MIIVIVSLIIWMIMKCLGFWGRNFVFDCVWWEGDSVLIVLVVWFGKFKCYY